MLRELKNHNPKHADRLIEYYRLKHRNLSEHAAIDEFEMTEEIDNKIQKMVFGFDGFWMIKLEKLLSNVLNMNMRLGRCVTGSDILEMQFVSTPGIFKIAIDFK